MTEELYNFYKPGKVTWLGLTLTKKGDVEPHQELSISLDNAIEGDHSRSKNRQVTLIQKENIEQVASFLGKEEIDPTLLRRNIVISGINLMAFKDKNVQIGEEVVLSITGDCHPCKLMEENLGKGGLSAMWGNGGLTCKVVNGGKIKIGDTVTPLS